MDASPTRRALFGFLALVPVAGLGAAAFVRPSPIKKPKAPHIRCGCEVVE